MSHAPERPGSGGRRRFLVEVRGYLQVEADSGAAANAAADAWIVAVARAAEGGAPPPPAPPGVSVRWLRLQPETDEHPGWPR